MSQHNPLDTDDEVHQQRIRERAYYLWEADGCPDGREAEFWERASELLGMQDSAGAGQLPNPAIRPGADQARTGIVEEAAIQENLGEFPSRFTDQGDRAQVPDARLKKAG